MNSWGSAMPRKALFRGLAEYIVPLYMCMLGAEGKENRYHFRKEFEGDFGLPASSESLC